MRILAIETSCDETAVAIVEGRGDFASAHITVTAEGLLSQIEQHKAYGGVYPTVAKREHAKNLTPLLVETIQQAGYFTEALTPLSPEHIFQMQQVLAREPELFAQLSAAVTTFQAPPIDAIAVTTGPGLEPALWVGINAARALATFWNLPLIPVNHMEGHVLSALAYETGDGLAAASAHVSLPATALLVSGGHTELVRMRDWLTYDLLGATKDDAVGEAFDKAARLLSLSYPGGPEISRLAANARERDLMAPFTLPRPMVDTDDYDFSYSGLKTALRYKLDEYGALTDDERAAVAREFEEAAIAPLIAKTRRALATDAPRTLIAAGGVIANPYLRAELHRLVTEEFPDTALALAPTRLATDNAVMIAIAAYFRALAGGYADPATLSADANANIHDR